MRIFTAICGAVALAALAAPSAHADEWNKKTYLTFSAPVQLPGTTLPAGTYTFELAAPDTSRHVIRISEKDSGKNIGLFLTVPQDRLDPPNENLIMFAERPAGSPQAVQAWFYPGDRIGEEFVYPKAQAMQIAKANRKGVLATEGGGVTANGSDAERMAALKGASVGRVDESGRMTSDDSKTATSTSTTTAQSTTAQAQTGTTADQSRRPADQPRTTTADQPRATAVQSRATTADNARAARAQTNTAGTSGRRELPRTASNLVALELLSVLALGSGLAIGQLRRRQNEARN
jgi:hypothetical protein